MKKLNSGSLLTIAVALAGIMSTVLSAKKDEADKRAMKEELKSEILDEISNNHQEGL